MWRQQAMKPGHMKITAIFLFFFLIFSGRAGFSLAVGETGDSSPKENGKLKTVSDTPMEMDRYPLAGLTLESPRETARAFWNNMNWAFAASLESGARSRKAQAFIERASNCLNLSKVPPTIKEMVRIEATFLLMEIFNRIDLPSYNSIPDKKMMKQEGSTKWTVPHTGITISKVLEGPHKGEYLFSSRSIDRLDEYYERSKHLPYKPNTWEKPYETYIYSPGTLIPHQWIENLPEWAKTPYLEQTLWQWIGLALAVLSAAFIVLIFYRLEYRQKASTKKSKTHWRFGKLLFPASGMALAWIVEVFIDLQLNITGWTLLVAKVGLQLVFFIFAGVAIVILGNILVNGITSSTRLQKRSIDNNLVRLSLRVLTLVMLFALFWYAANYFGLSVTAVFASAGIAGLAIAMAARETLANFFGGISLLLDKPFTTGNYIILDSGERGEVVDIGLRSTRMLTRDEILICIPNSVITNVKIVNESAPAPRFRIRIKIGVAYGTDVEQVEDILMKLAQGNELAANNPVPRVRFRAFGDSSLDFELLCWARRPEEKGRLIHTLNKEIYHALNEADIAIPFPQRDVHLIPVTETAPEKS